VCRCKKGVSLHGDAPHKALTYSSDGERRTLSLVKDAFSEPLGNLLIALRYADHDCLGVCIAHFGGERPPPPPPAL
jgi:hypothetical protein